MTTPRRDLATTEPPTPAAAPERPQSKGWFPELADVLFELSGTLSRTFIVIGVIALGAMVMAYGGASTGHYRIAMGALAVFGLAMLAWCAAGFYFLWVNVRVIGKWLIARRRNAAGEPADNASAIRAAGTE